APLDDLAFTCHEVAGLDHVLAYPDYEAFSPELIASVFNEAARFATERLAPLNRKGDVEGCSIDSAGQVKFPEGFAEAYQEFVQQGWNAAPFPAEHGGQGLPHMVATGLSEIWNGANLSFALTPILTHSAVFLLMYYGDEWAQKTILPKLVSGEWCGTMCMTEPQAGSDVGAVRAQAIPQGDGSYRLKGSKIFISCGDHNAAENIIHMVLARLPDAPEGSKGLSLFMVPKFLVNEDGSLGEKNDVHAVSLEHKLGMHGSPTAVMAYGDQEGAYATLIGKEGEGLKAMFTMMNAARLAVGIEGLGIAEAATQQAKAYANERIQGREAATDHTQPVPIARHGDVKRMLHYMEAHAQALRALALYTGGIIDNAAHDPDAAVREQAKGRLDLLTPVMKAHTTNMAFRIASEAIQVHGGLGYIEETGVAQFLRDVRVSMIYEGTNGIQALDLAHRKLPMGDGAVLNQLMGEIQQTSAHLKENDDFGLRALGEALDTALKHLADASSALLLQVKCTASNTEGEAPSTVSAVPYLELLGLVMEGHLMGRAAIRAHALLQSEDSTYSKAFLSRKLAMARFFLLDVLLDTASLKERVVLGDKAIKPQTGLSA
ncbi:MAG: acyl-CoA dehydrogenase, partial [Rickettsiales bacterium]